MTIPRNTDLNRLLHGIMLVSIEFPSEDCSKTPNFDRGFLIDSGEAWHCYVHPQQLRAPCEYIEEPPRQNQFNSYDFTITSPLPI